MSKLHKGQYDAPNLEPSEGQRGLLCSNKASFRCPSLSSSSILQKDTLHVLEELGSILRAIHFRIKREGYDVQDGALIKTDYE